MIEQTLPSGLEDLAQLQSRHSGALLALPNVNGVALGTRHSGGQDTGEQAITVLVEHKAPAELLSPDDLVPSRLDGVATDVVEVGVLTAGGPATAELSAPPAEELEEMLRTPQDTGAQLLRQRVRPARGGYSIGHHRVTAGTMGTVCYDLKPFPSMPQRYYALSNNHVLANSNDARVGDPILQPGRADGGTYPADVIARLSRWVPIRFRDGDSAPCNYVDAAIAEGEFHDLDRFVHWVGSVKHLYSAPKVGDVLQKTGRTTNFTTGQVQNINATVDVNYGAGRVARFCRQVVTTAMSAGGDSGSLVTDLDEGGVGLLFAGSPSVTLVNNLAYVQSLLRVRITEK